MGSVNGLVVGGVMCVLIGVGHATIGLAWVLPRLVRDSLPRTPFGSPAMTEAMVRVTWHAVTLFALGLGALLLALSALPGSDPTTLMLRVFGTTWLSVVVMALFVLRRNARDLLRRPFSLAWVSGLSTLGILLWKLST